MASRYSTLLENDTVASQVSTTTSRSTLPNAFNRMIQPAPVVQSTVKRDRCTRPTPTYNHNYNLYKKPPVDLRSDYSPYIYREPLYDDQLIIIARLLTYYIVSGPIKKP